jgi:hypothetical protein
MGVPHRAECHNLCSCVSVAQVMRREGDRSLNIALWVVQVLLALLFLFAGGIKLVMPIDEILKQMPLALPGGSCGSSESSSCSAGSA